MPLFVVFACVHYGHVPNIYTKAQSLVSELQETEASGPRELHQRQLFQKCTPWIPQFMWLCVCMCACVCEWEREAMACRMSGPGNEGSFCFCPCSFLCFSCPHPSLSKLNRVSHPDPKAYTDPDLTDGFSFRMIICANNYSVTGLYIHYRSKV